MVEVVRECPDTGLTGPSPRLDFPTVSGCWSAGEYRSEEAGTPLEVARGVVAPSMAWSSVAADVLTGRKEAMRGGRNPVEAGDVKVGSFGDRDGQRR